MNQNHQVDSEHSDSINESRINKVSHTRHWIEFSILIIVVAVLAIIVIPTITTISKSADYTTAYSHSKDIVGAFKVAHADAQYESITIPSTTITFTSNHLKDSSNTLNQDQSIESIYYNFIVERLKTYLSGVENPNFSFKLIKTSNLIVLYYWNNENQATSSSESGYRDPDYVCYVECYTENQDIKVVTYDEFKQLNLLPTD